MGVRPPGERKIAIGPHDDGTIDREELLRREIPLSFLTAAQKCFPRHKIVVRGLVTHSDVRVVEALTQWANLL